MLSAFGERGAAAAKPAWRGATPSAWSSRPRSLRRTGQLGSKLLPSPLTEALTPIRPRRHRRPDRNDSASPEDDIRVRETKSGETGVAALRRRGSDLSPRAPSAGQLGSELP